MLGTEEQSGSITLAFTSAAIRALARPTPVLSEANRWSKHTGVVASDPEDVAALVRRFDIPQDYVFGNLERRTVLSRLKWEASTERYVFVGTDQGDRELAEYIRWEYLTIDEAAERAGWRLKSDRGRAERLWDRLVDRVARISD